MYFVLHHGDEAWNASMRSRDARREHLVLAANAIFHALEGSASYAWMHASVLRSVVEN